MTNILYKGIFREDREIYSRYCIDSVSYTEIFRLKNEIGYNDTLFLDQHNKRLETMMVRNHIRKSFPMLFQWLNKTGIPHGGIINWAGNTYNQYDIDFLLGYRTEDDLAFRLCYNIKMEEN